MSSFDNFAVRLLVRLVNMGFQWFSVTLCYYGLSFASTSLSDNVWTNYLLRNCQIITVGTRLASLHYKSVFFAWSALRPEI